MSEGLARKCRILSLEGRLHIAFVDHRERREVSRLGSPGDQSVCVVLTCHRMDRDRLDIATQPARIVQDDAARRREPLEKRPRDRVERRHCSIAANKFAAGE